MNATEKAQSLYVKFKKALAEDNIEEARLAFVALDQLVEKSDENMKQKASQYWSLRQAGKEDEAQAVLEKMEEEADDVIDDARWGAGDPLAVGTLKGLRFNRCDNFLIDSFDPCDRYRFDFELCPSKEGWLQYDTREDAHYFGVWVHKERRMIVTYAEGDIGVTYCPSVESFNRDIRRMNEFYDEGRIATAIGEDGVTVYRQDREQFFIH